MKFNGGRGLHLSAVAGVVILGLFATTGYGQTTLPATTAAPSVAVDKSNIMTAAPGEAWAAVVINDLAKTSKQIDEYANRLGAKPPALQREIFRMLGVAGKVESSSPMVVVILDKTRYGDKPVAVILSVKDFDQLKTTFNAKPTETAGVFKGEKEEIGDVYFAKKGPFVVMGPTPSIVTGVSAANQPLSTGMDSGSNSLMKKSDVYARVNFPSLNQFIKPLLTMFGAMAQMGGMGGMGGGEEGGEAQQNPQTMAQMQMMGTMINALVMLLDEITGFDLGVTFGADMVKSSAILSFKSGQEVAGVLAAQKMTSESLLKGLPGDGFAAAMGYQWQPKKTKFLDALLQISPPLPDPADAEKYKALMKEASDIGTASSFSLNVRAPKPGEPMLELNAVLQTKDAKKYMAIARQSIELQNKTKISAKGQEISMESKYEPGVAKVGSVPVDQVTINIGKMLGQQPGMSGEQGQQMKIFLAMAFGNAEGLIQYRLAPVNDKTVILTLGTSQAELEKLVKAATAGSAPLADDPRIVKTRSLLPASRFMEGYIDIGDIVDKVKSVATAMETDNTTTTKTSAKPAAAKTSLVGLAGTVDGSAIQIDSVLPFDVISYLYSLKGMIPHDTADMTPPEDNGTR